MNNEFIPYEQALELKQLGFDEPCLRYFVPTYNDTHVWAGLHEKSLNDDDCPAPLYQQAFRWFREKYGLVCYVKYDSGIFEAFTDGGYYSKFNTFQEAELACLKKLIEVVKTK